MNLDLLLAPTAEASPCGVDLSFSPEFDAIQELRRADDPTLDQGEWLTSLRTADWPGVLRLCEQVLARSKDLRLASWLTEAEARVNGYAGLADGLELCGQLCERFWADLHPNLEAGGDAEARGGNMRWLLGRVEALAPQLPALRHGAQAFSVRDIELAQAQGRSGERSTDVPTVIGVITAEDVAAARRATPHDWLASNLAAAQRAQRALAALQQVIDGHLGDEGPAFTAARRALEDAVHSLALLGPGPDPQPPATAPSFANPGAGAETPSTGASGPLRSRVDALRQLRDVAEYFRRTEPHSPVAYLAERAAQWGDMPLHLWLRAVVKDAGSLSQIEELLGVEPPPPREG